MTIMVGRSYLSSLAIHVIMAGSDVDSEREASEGQMSSTTGPIDGHPVQLIHEGQDRLYLLHIPPTVPAEGLPLVLGLHGRGIDAAWFDRLTGYSSLVEEAGFVLALPNALNERWNDGRDPSVEPSGGPDDVGYLAAVIDDVIARLPIDERRIYVVGLSNGASMAGRLACELVERIAAVAQVAGTAAVGVAAGCRPPRPVPILNIHGSADPYAPYAGGTRRSLRGRLLLRPASRPMVGVDAWARFWVAANGAIDGPLVSTLPPDTTIRTWHGPSPASDVVFARIEGGGHTWPGGHPTLPGLLFGRTSRAFSATRVSWDFFAAHTR